MSDIKGKQYLDSNSKYYVVDEKMGKVHQKNTLTVTITYGTMRGLIGIQNLCQTSAQRNGMQSLGFTSNMT